MSKYQLVFTKPKKNLVYNTKRFMVYINIPILQIPSECHLSNTGSFNNMPE